MTLHGHLLVEGHVAHRTRERPQPRVDGEMLFKVVFMVVPAEDLAALWARGALEERHSEGL